MYLGIYVSPYTCAIHTDADSSGEGQAEGEDWGEGESDGECEGEGRV